MKLRSRHVLVPVLAVGLALTSALQAEAAVQNVAAWSLTTGGTDSTGNGHTAVVDPTMSGVVFGPSGASFNDHGRLVVAASPQLSPGSRDFSFGLSYVTTFDNHANLLQAGNTHLSDPFVKIEIAGVPKCRITGSLNSIPLKAQTSTVDGRWHTIRCSRTGSLLQLTIDGVVVAKRTVDVGVVNISAEKWYIGAKAGRNVDTGDTFFGTIRDAFIAIAP